MNAVELKNLMEQALEAARGVTGNPTVEVVMERPDSYFHYSAVAGFEFVEIDAKPYGDGLRVSNPEVPKEDRVPALLLRRQTGFVTSARPSKTDGPIIEGTWTMKAGELRVFKVDDGDGSGAEPRCDVNVKHNGEAGSGGKLQRLRLDQVEELIAALQQALPRMRGAKI